MGHFRLHRDDSSSRLVGKRPISKLDGESEIKLNFLLCGVEYSIMALLKYLEQENTDGSSRCK